MPWLCYYSSTNPDNANYWLIKQKKKYVPKNSHYAKLEYALNIFMKKKLIEISMFISIEKY